MTLLPYIKLVHIISAMVYFGLPFLFGRWFGVCAKHEATADSMLKALKTITFLHLNIAAALLLGTGIWLVNTLNLWVVSWPVWALGLLGLSVLNLNLNLGLALLRFGRNPTDPDIQKHTRIRIIFFSATHHTLVTLSTALMVWW